MSIQKPQSVLIKHKQDALKALEDYIDSLISSAESADNGKADKLCYWLEDYTRFLRKENNFKATSYQKYKRGQIVKVHLGYNVGSEEGGLHYAIVIDSNNSILSPVVTIVPLTSLKRSEDIPKIRPDRGEIYLGNELHRLLTSKTKILQEKVVNELKTNKKVTDSLLLQIDNKTKEEIKKLPIEDLIRKSNRQLKQSEKEFALIKKSIKEIKKMKLGSIALVNQITTVSKIRIYDPITGKDVLSNIRMSNESLDRIDEAIKNLFTHK